MNAPAQTHPQTVDAGLGSAPQVKPLFEAQIVRTAIAQSFVKLDPRRMIKNPVMFVVEVGSAFTTLLWLNALLTGHGEASPAFIAAVSIIVCVS